MNTETYNNADDIEYKGAGSSEQETNSSLLSSSSSEKKRRKEKDVIPGQSFGRKLDLFKNAAEMKRRRTIEEQEWKKQHSRSADSSNRSFKPMDNDGVSFIEAFHISSSTWCT